MDSNVPSNSKWNLEFKLPKGPFFHVMCVCVFLDLLLFFFIFLCRTKYTHIFGKNKIEKMSKIIPLQKTGYLVTCQIGHVTN
jgi:hypothetical protein